MIQLKSKLEIVDNSGAKVASCIKVLNNKSKASLGDEIIVSIKKALPNKKIKAGEVHKALVVGLKYKNRRINGSFIKERKNRAILLTKANQSQGSRSLGPINRDIGNYFSKKILFLAKKII